MNNRSDQSATQGETFLHTEGDAWFARNASALDVNDLWTHDVPLKLLAQSAVKPTAVLEVGAANGYRLAAIAKRYACAVTAVEPSQVALRDGEQRFPSIQFVHGLAHNMPALEDNSFDLVIIQFVMHWIDRAQLFRSIAEIDRLLMNGGHLIVGDFLPSAAQRVRYHHLPEQDVWTFKQDYSRVWTESQLYREIDGITFDHRNRECSGAIDPSHRARVALLRKDLRGAYAVGSFT